MIRIRLLVMATCLASAGQLLAQEDSFESKVAPILTERCLGCHNDSESKGGFSLQTSAAILDSGFVEPGDATESALLEIITETNGQPPEMPKTGPPLSHQQVQEIRQWIERGAHWPATVELNPDASANFDWWSLEPLARPKLPERTAAVPTAWRSNPVDAFIWQKLNDQGLTPSREAD
ncbi:MAG: c-type cytochrome domain-containing protein, partial [Planctomycetota bacterium]|nr:c-type cytochrome domain-containing protein [Planctomycetota bacterium]